jgi:outer membrane PBP1 activator LpoA protein
MTGNSKEASAVSTAFHRGYDAGYARRNAEEMEATDPLAAKVIERKVLAAQVAIAQMACTAAKDSIKESRSAHLKAVNTVHRLEERLTAVNQEIAALELGA